MPSPFFHSSTGKLEITVTLPKTQDLCKCVSVYTCVWGLRKLNAMPPALAKSIMATTRLRLGSDCQNIAGYETYTTVSPWRRMKNQTYKVFVCVCYTHTSCVCELHTQGVCVSVRLKRTKFNSNYKVEARERTSEYSWVRDLYNNLALKEVDDQNFKVLDIFKIYRRNWCVTVCLCELHTQGLCV